MIDNTSLLRQLLSRREIEMEAAPFLNQEPAPLPDTWDFARVEGMLLGLAIGDALGNTSESQLPSSRREAHGEIRNYLPNRHANNQPVGVPSDDTQLAFWTLEQLLDDGGLNPDNLAQRFSRGQIFGIGNTIRDFLRAYQLEGLPWQRAGQPSAGNGALMRIAPVLLPHLHKSSPALWADAALAGMVTHNDRASNACCVAFTHLLWECLRLEQPPDPAWWLETFLTPARQLEGQTVYMPRSPALDYQGPLWQLVEREVGQALRENWPVYEACQRWYSGAYLLETVPCALYILARHGDDPEEALIRAVNDTRDNDTIAAIVGAAVGALHGRAKLPRAWIMDLTGRLGADDDWAIFELLQAARVDFWQADPPISDANLQAVLAYLPRFEQPDFSPGEWVAQPNKVPYFDYTNEVLDFLRILGQNLFLQPFNWPDWVEVARLVQNPDLLSRVSLPTLRRLLTAHVRADHFNEGHLAAMFEKGHLVAVLRRLDEIYKTGENQWTR
jgi:ADP-ribosyl-[dinitrogen reductase] hydrolase